MVYSFYFIKTEIFIFKFKDWKQTSVKMHRSSKQISRDELVLHDENFSMYEIKGEIKGARNEM